ncbi:MAG: DUF4198 domain-containing protein [Desulfohalobiaceae bacterium]
MRRQYAPSSRFSAYALLPCLAVLLLFCLAPVNAWAHFGTAIPSPAILDQDTRQTEITFSFIHPFEQHGMDLAKPEQVFAVNMASGKKQDITSGLEETQLLGHKAWSATYQPRRPGAYAVVMEPKPYWEPAENLFIKHWTKTYLGAFGDARGWDEPVGLETEIVPLTRPFGLYAGNAFQGRVLMNGEPVPGAEVEVEYYNEGGKADAPNEHMVTQVVKADENGVFTYVPPRSGWWGFSALNEAGYTLEHEGEEKAVELGAVLWVQFLPWSGK